jgi:hypothetical protein
MVGLLDIAPLSKTVKIQNAEIKVTGVSARGIAFLIGRFPEVKALFAEKSEPITPERLMQLAPEALAAVLACGCGYVEGEGAKKAEEVISNLSAGDQLELLSAVLELTMPQGAGPFVEKLTAMVAAVGGGGSGKAPVSKSQPESSG